MARDTPHVQDDILYDPTLPPVPVGSDAWWAWLAQTSPRSFSVTLAGSTYTARTESRRGKTYWYAYRRHKGLLNKTYLGRAGDLTPERLRAAGRQLEALQRGAGGAAPTGGGAAPGTGSLATALLPAKLAIPQLRRSVVVRPRLLTLLDRAVDHRLTLVRAPAGYGKTTLLATWLASLVERQRGAGNRQARRSEDRFPLDFSRLPAPPQVAAAWLTLDAGDRDPARLWVSLGAVLRQVLPDVAPPHPPALGAARMAEGVLAALAAALALLPHDLVLVLDEVDAAAGPPLWDAVLALLDRLPRLHLVIAARGRPNLPLGRMRARGELLEVRAGALRFSVDEAAAVLGDALPAERVAALTAQTEGWPAGIKLAALALQDPASAAWEPASAGAPGVREYLIEEVVRRQPPEVQRFLRATSILDPLCAELCGALLAAAGEDAERAWSLLEAAEQAGLFLTALDADGRWYRYHPLFAGALRALLLREERTAVPRLHRAASEWYAAQGLLAPAVEHAIQGDAPLAAAAWAAAAAPQAIARGEWATVIRWTASLPDGALLAHPDLLVMAGWGLLVSGRPAEARRPLALLDALPADSHAADRATLRAYLAVVERDAAGLRALAPAALESLAATGGLLYGVIAIPAALAGAAAGSLDTIAGALESASAAADAHGDRYTARTARHLLAQLAIARGRLHEAAAIYLRDLPDPGDAEVQPLDAIPLMGLGEVRRMQGDPAAGALLEQAWEAAARLRDGGVEASAAISLARLRLSQGDAAGADALLHEAMRRVGRDGATGLRAPLAAHRAVAALGQGDLATARRWVDATGIVLDARAPNLLQAVEELALARVRIASGAAGAAAGRLAQLRDQAAAGGWHGWTLEIDALGAVALQRAGDEAGALAALARALTLAAPEGARQVILDAGAEVVALLDTHRAALDGRLPPDGRQLAAALRAAPAQGAVTQEGAALAEPLSARELEVLQLVAAGHTNQAVADALILAVGTVKKHLHTIFGKLGARSRTEAVARARDLGLLR